MPHLEYPAPHGSVPAYLAVPDGPTPAPGVVVLHDALGLTPDIMRITDRLAAAGYRTLTPALYRRGNRVRCVVSTFRSQFRGQGSAMEAIVAARDHLAADPLCTGKVGVIGFCMGGGFCLLFAPRGVFDAAAANYGVVPQGLPDMSDSCPVVASYGARDVLLRGAARRLESELTARGVAHDVAEYPGVGHGFMNDWSHPPALQFVERIAGLQYSAPEAEHAWERILDFFAAHLSSES